MHPLVVSYDRTMVKVAAFASPILRLRFRGRGYDLLKRLSYDNALGCSCDARKFDPRLRSPDSHACRRLSPKSVNRLHSIRRTYASLESRRYKNQVMADAIRHS